MSSPQSTLSPPGTEAEWFYSINGNRFGPASEIQILDLIQRGILNDQAMIWSRSMPEWQPILQSRFADFLRNPNMPPPLPGKAVDNTIVWILAFAPLIGVMLEGFFSGLTGIAEDSLWFITLALNIVLCICDEKKLKAAGHDTSRMGGAWIVPVYLFRRAKALNHKYAYFIVWCVLFGLLILG